MPVDLAPQQELIKELSEKRLRAYHRINEIAEGARKEGRDLSAEERQSFDRAHAEFEELGQDIERRRALEKAADALNAPVPHRGADAIVGAPGTEVNADAFDPKVRSDAYRAAFMRYMRKGVHGLNGEQRDALAMGYAERRDMGEATGAAGGYLVPPGFLAKLTEVQKYFGGMRSVANVIETTNGESLVWPVNDDTGNPAVIIAEDTQVSELDLTLTQNSLGAWMWTTGAVRVGRALMQDSAFDLESVLTDRFGKRFGRGQNTKFTSGTGTGQPKGARSFAAATGVTTFDYAGLVGLKYAVDYAYRQSPAACFMMSDTAVKDALLLTDTAGRPLFVPAGSFGSLASERPDTLLGSPIVVNNDLDAPGTGNIPALFGDFKAGYIIRDVVGSNAILRLEERYADYGEIGFIGYARADGTIDDPNAVKRLQM